MDKFRLFTSDSIASLTNKRDGEQKLGQHVQVVDSLNQIAKSTAKFVIVGIPEDIGVRANHGIPGAKTAWEPTLKTLLNFQSNAFLKGNEVLMLGDFNIEEPLDHSLQGLRIKTAQIDELVAPVIVAIVMAGKIPVVVGGGHNNAFPIIKGVSEALKKEVAVINIDAHADLRNTEEGRHSGNPFSNALEQGYLRQYRVFGLQQNYVNEQLQSVLENQELLSVMYFEELLKAKRSIPDSFEEFTTGLIAPCGLEIDLDSIENILSSAVSPTGFSLNDIRKIILNSKQNYCYLHICEGAQVLANGMRQEIIGKVIANLIVDFIKALQPHIYLQP
jgi:formiminoglutamase